MSEVRCRIAGSTLAALLVLLATQPALPQASIPEADRGREDVSGRHLPEGERADGGYVPPRPLFDGLGDDELLGGEPRKDTDPDLYFTDEREEFLEDGGGISAPEPTLQTLKYRKAEPDRGWRDLPSPRTTYRTIGSFTVAYSDPGDRRLLPTVPGLVEFGVAGRFESPKVIDVASERLDRRAIPPSGIEVINAGGPKIIRIAQDYDRTATRAIEAAEEERAASMEPWSPAWSSWCSRAHASFDADLGTYKDAGGRSRFCTGD